MIQNGRVDYSDRSPFVQLLEGKGSVRILDVLLRKHSSDLSKSEIAKLADIHPSTVGRNINELVEMGVVQQIETDSGDRFRLDLEKELVKTLGQFHTELLSYRKAINEGKINGIENEIKKQDLEKFKEQQDSKPKKSSLQVIGDELSANV